MDQNKEFLKGLVLERKPFPCTIYMKPKSRREILSRKELSSCGPHHRNGLESRRPGRREEGTGKPMRKNLGRWMDAIRKKEARQRGQGMVEFALVLPILILLLIGVMEFGYFFFVYSTANTAAREAVRYGSATGDSANGVPYYEDCNGIEEVASRIGRYANIQPGDVQIFYDSGPGTTSLGSCGAYEPALGERIVVHIDVEYNTIMLFTEVDPFTTISAESARTIIKRLQVGE